MVTLGEDFLLGIATGISVVIFISAIGYINYRKVETGKQLIRMILILSISTALTFTMVTLLDFLYNVDLSGLLAFAMVVLPASIGALSLLLSNNSGSLIRDLKALGRHTESLSKRNLHETYVYSNSSPIEIRRISGNVKKLQDEVESTILKVMGDSGALDELKDSMEVNSRALDSNLSNFKMRVEFLQNNAEQLQSTQERLKEHLTSMEESLKRLSNTSVTMSKKLLGIINQSKIIAVNASIEASRSLESSSGFNIVADSMSSLSSLSGNEINQLIGVIDEFQSDFSLDLIQLKQMVRSLGGTSAKSKEEITELATDLEDLAANFNELNIALQNGSENIASISRELSSYEL